MRFFNTAGPVNSEDHYCLAPLQRFVLALKILHKSLEKTLEKGLEQTWQYMDRCGIEVWGM